MKKLRYEKIKYLGSNHTFLKREKPSTQAHVLSILHFLPVLLKREETIMNIFFKLIISKQCPHRFPAPGMRGGGRVITFL